MTTIADIKNHKTNGPCRGLEKLAHEMVQDVSTVAKSALLPVLGGGTRLMLAMEHRISDDIDLFIRDPQWIGFLTPRLNDKFEHLINTYDEGATSLKLKFNDGEIDFIVSMSLLGLDNKVSSECLFPLEPVAEVLAKKLFYRGWALTPRDLFDWHAIERYVPLLDTHELMLAELIAARVDGIRMALDQMGTSKQSAIVWQEIRTHELPDLKQTIQWAQGRLGKFQAMSEQAGKDKASGRRPVER